jgi:hypothetical protein
MVKIDINPIILGPFKLFGTHIPGYNPPPDYNHLLSLSAYQQGWKYDQEAKSIAQNQNLGMRDRLIVGGYIIAWEGSHVLLALGLAGMGGGEEAAVEDLPNMATEEGGFNPSTVSGSPNYIVTNNGDTIPVPDGAEGPSPANNGLGFKFTDGSGGNGLDPRVSGVRIMDPTDLNPGGYASYFNARGQTVNPFTGQTISPNDIWWHIGINLH